MSRREPPATALPRVEPDRQHPSRDGDDGWTVIGRSRGIDVQELWEYRDLAYFLALRDLKVRYKQTFFGVAWVLLQPLAGAAIFTAVFGRIVDLPSDGLPYVVFVFAGLVLWAYFSSSVEASAESLVDRSALVTKVYFPRLLAPIAAVLPGLVDLLISLVFLVVFMVVFGVAPSLFLVLAPLWLLALVGLAFAVGVWLAALNVQYRDVRHAFGFVIQLWLFASPVVYPSSLIEGGWEFAYAANPLVGILDGFRWSFLDGPAPEPSSLVSLASGLLILLSGLYYFRRVERRFADVI